MTRLLLVFAVGFAALRPGVGDGRAGNMHLDAGDAPAAATAYRAGVARAGVSNDTAARLWHNLGIALARDSAQAAPGAPAGVPPDSSAVTADSAFAQALRLAADPADRARYAYDAGTAALLAGRFEPAVALLRRSLVLDPARADARRNYEIARRRLAAQQTPPTPPEPSAFARAVKARADALVADRRYRDALGVMTDGLARDSTVAAYAEFTGRLGGVVEIEETPGTPAPAAPVPAPRPEPPPAPAGPTRI